MDGINVRYGRDMLAYAAAGQRKAWKLSRDFMSSRYTMDWNELLRVC
jgi:hypothetical protein